MIVVVVVVVVMVMVVIMVAIGAVSVASLRCLLLAHSHLLLRLPLDVLNELGHSHAGPLGVDGELALHGLDLLGRRSLARHRHGDLARPGLRGWRGHCAEYSVNKKSVEKS